MCHSNTGAGLHLPMMAPCRPGTPLCPIPCPCSPGGAPPCPHPPPPAGVLWCTALAWHTAPVPYFSLSPQQNR